MAVGSMPKITFDPVTFQEAVDYFKAKLPLSAEEFALLFDEAKALAFNVAHVSSLDILTEVHKELGVALEEGATVRDFRKSVNGLLEAKGFEGLTPFRADNIFRTNMQTALQVGRYKQMTHPSVVQARPYWMYLAVDDNDVRPHHFAHHEHIYPADHPFWDTWYPPNGYRCRCTVVTLSADEVEGMGLEVEESIPTVAETEQGVVRLAPDEGFAFNPGKVAWEADLSKYPSELREAFEAVRSAAE